MKSEQQITDIYPLNLMCDVFGNADDAIKVYIPGIYDALATLSEREIGVLQKRYCDKMTLIEVGKAYNVTRERIRQIEAKALRKLRHPIKTAMFRAVPMAELKEQQANYRKLSNEYELLNRAFEYCSAKPAEQPTIASMAEMAKTSHTRIEDLDFSVRTYNCLKRAGKNTLGDIVEMTDADFMKVRNLGRKSMEEAKNCIKKYGFEVKGETA